MRYDTHLDRYNVLTSTPLLVRNSFNLQTHNNVFKLIFTLNPWCSDNTSHINPIFKKIIDP